MNWLFLFSPAKSYVIISYLCNYHIIYISLFWNDQSFTGNPANRNLIVIYGASTKSIPAQTIPYIVVVICQI